MFPTKKHATRNKEVYLVHPTKMPKSSSSSATMTTLHEKNNENKYGLVTAGRSRKKSFVGFCKKNPKLLELISTDINNATQFGKFETVIRFSHRMMQCRTTAARKYCNCLEFEKNLSGLITYMNYALVVEYRNHKCHCTVAYHPSSGGSRIVQEKCENCGGKDATCPELILKRSDENPEDDTHSFWTIDWSDVPSVERDDRRNGTIPTNEL